MEKLTLLGDVSTPMFAGLGLATATSETLEIVFLSLTVVSLTITIVSRLYKAYVSIKSKTQKALEDNVLTQDEMNDIIEDVKVTVETFANGVEEVTEVIENGKRPKKD